MRRALVVYTSHRNCVPARRPVQRDDTVARGAPQETRRLWRAFEGLRYTRRAPTHWLTVLPNTNSKPEVDAHATRAEAGRLLALDLGARRVGLAVSDELRLTVRPLPALPRSSWKKLLGEIKLLREQFDARGVVIGLPLNMDGTEGAAGQDARRIARNLGLSLDVPVFLQDERLTSRAAEAELRAEGVSGADLKARVDSAAAALILRDCLARSE